MEYWLIVLKKIYIYITCFQCIKIFNGLFFVQEIIYYTGYKAANGCESVREETLNFATKLFKALFKSDLTRCSMAYKWFSCANENGVTSPRSSKGAWSEVLPRWLPTGD